MSILGFRTSTYATAIYLDGTDRLTARDGYTGVAAGYYTPVEQYAANLNNVQNPVVIKKANIDNALVQGWINQQEYNETIAFIPVTPPTPNVTNDDTLNTVTGMAIGMEYNLDNVGYVPYDATTFNAIDFSGNHTLLVRVAASGINPPSAVVTLTFTTNLV